MNSILVTGGAGFIGSNFVRKMAETNTQIVILDAFTYAGHMSNLQGVEISLSSKIKMYSGDIRNKELVSRLLKKYNVTKIVHFAAESHVDRSITGPEEFVSTNVLGTQILLDCFNRHLATVSSCDGPLFLHISTDEVYGSLQMLQPAFTEDSSIEPNSPYSASKAGSDFLVLAYGTTYGMPVIVTRCSNNYGPYQMPEKLIPLVITNLLQGKKVPVYGTGQNVRDWIHVDDHVEAIQELLVMGRPGNVYNIGSCAEKTNLDVVKLILDILDKPYSAIEYVEDRKGHDFRYAINNKKLLSHTHWAPKYTFEWGLSKTVHWYVDNEAWWRPLLEKAKL